MAIIQSLIAQIQAIYAQRGLVFNSPLVGASPSVSVQTTSFYRDLQVGDVGEDVRSLQKYLNTHGFVISSVGIGSPGNETTTFGPATRSALIQFQQSKGISPASGYFGPLTRSLMK